MWIALAHSSSRDNTDARKVSSSRPLQLSVLDCCLVTNSKRHRGLESMCHRLLAHDCDLPWPRRHAGDRSRMSPPRFRPVWYRASLFRCLLLRDRNSAARCRAHDPCPIADLQHGAFRGGPGRQHTDLVGHDRCADVGAGARAVRVLSDSDRLSELGHAAQRFRARHHRRPRVGSCRCRPAQDPRQRVGPPADPVIGRHRPWRPDRVVVAVRPRSTNLHPGRKLRLCLLCRPSDIVWLLSATPPASRLRAGRGRRCAGAPWLRRAARLERGTGGLLRGSGRLWLLQPCLPWLGSVRGGSIAFGCV